MNNEFDISVIPWPAYDERTHEPFWTVRVVHSSQKRGAGSYRLTWAHKQRRWVRNGEFKAAFLRSTQAVERAELAVLAVTQA